MLLAVMVGHLPAKGKQFFKLGVNDEFLANGVTGELPGELVAPSDFLVGGLSAENVLVSLFQLTVVVLDGFANLGHTDGRGREESRVDGVLVYYQSWSGCKGYKPGGKDHG